MIALVKESDEEKIRDRLRDFIAAGGHGAVGQFADECGLSREYVGRFRNGLSVGAATLRVIVDTLDRLDGGAALPAGAAAPHPTPMDLVAKQFGMLESVASDSTIPVATRWALCKEGLAGVDKHLAPLIEKWIEQFESSDDKEG